MADKDVSEIYKQLTPVEKEWVMKYHQLSPRFSGKLSKEEIELLVKLCELPPAGEILSKMVRQMVDIQKNSISEEIAFVQTCRECGHKNYWFDYPVRAYIGLQRNVQMIWCGKCEKKNIELEQIPLKDWEELRRKFPNKKTIYTNKTVEELLKLPDNDTTEPVESEGKWGRSL